jgi:transcriptional regulator with XRE-family HTH domain
MDIGKKIRALRKEQGLLQYELANRIMISPESVSLYENGYRTPDITILNSFADVFNVSLDYLAGRTLYRGILKENIIEFEIENPIIREELAEYLNYLNQRYNNSDK